jgi:alpha-L-rhamnosidase
VTVSDLMLGHYTTFEIRVLFDTFDVSAMLQPGTSNAIACTVANGWFGGADRMKMIPNAKEGNKGFIAMLNVKQTNGIRSRVGTNTANWTASLGPYDVAGVFEGVQYDAAKETTGWTLPNFAPTTPWQQATAFNDTWDSAKTILNPALVPPLRRTSFSLIPSIT